LTKKSLVAVARSITGHNAFPATQPASAKHWKHLLGTLQCCINVAYCYRWSRMVWRSVSLLVCHSREPYKNEMPFGIWTRVGQGNCVLDWVQIPHAKGQFW